MADPADPNAPGGAPPNPDDPNADWGLDTNNGDGGDANMAAPTSERILNQDEIDSLLGFDVGDGDNQDKSGVRAIINSALVSYERLPMLEIVFDRLVRLMTT